MAALCAAPLVAVAIMVWRMQWYSVLSACTGGGGVLLRTIAVARSSKETAAAVAAPLNARVLQ